MATSESQSRPGNPVLPVYAADPDAHLFGDRYYIYATNAGFYPDRSAFETGDPTDVGHGFAAWSSPDLRNWTSEGPILRFSQISWARDLANAWAPCVAARNGRYYFYFCADSRIGVAVGDSPTGPFEDALGRPLIEYRDDLSAIDPMVFVDDDGAAYLYWGAVPGYWLEEGIEYVRMHLSVQRLADDMVTLLGEERPTIFTRPSLGGWASRDHIEATHVIRRGATYHLMWSEGSFSSADPEESYRVRAATARSPWGPWHIAPEPILDSRPDLSVIGPGHHGVIRIPGINEGSDEWWCVYHHHPGDADRRVSIDPLTFTEGDTIAPIVPTRDGPPVRPVTLALTLKETGPFAAGKPIAFRIAAREPMERIELFAGETQIGEGVGGASEWTWSDPPMGFARIHARGTTAKGGAVSASIDLDVR